MLKETLLMAIPQFKREQVEIFGRKFEIGVRIISMADYNQAMKSIEAKSAEDIAGIMAKWFFDPETGDEAFAAADMMKLPACTVKELMRLFTEVNTGAKAQNP